MSSFADILRQEYKSKGFLPGLATTTGKKSLEVLDIRNALFGGSGTGSIIGRKIFGRGYSATASRGEKSPTSVAASDNSLSEIRDNSVISAKNSMALPIIASQINIMQKNIAKLVRIQGESPSQKADAFFASAKFRENAYESALSQGKKSPTPVMAAGKKDTSFGLLSALGLVGTALLLFGDKLGTTAKIIGGVIVGLVALKGILMAIAAMQGVKSLLGIGGGRGAGKAVATRAKGAQRRGGGRFGALLGLLGGGLLGYGLTRDDESMVDEFDEPMNQGMTGLEGALVGAGAGLGVYGASKFVQPKLQERIQSKSGGPMAFNEKAQRFTQNKKFVSAKNIPLSQILEKLRNYYIRVSSAPGLKNFVLKKLTSKFGIAVVLRLSAFLAGFAAAPFTAGLSGLISLASWGLTAYTLYEVYDWLFGEDNNAENMITEYESLQQKDKLEKDAKSALEQKSPEQLAGPGMPVPSQVPSETGEKPLQYDRQSVATRRSEESKKGSTLRTTPTRVGSSDVGQPSDELINFIKQKEGFLPNAKWDFKQWSIGYGTKSFEGEGPITEVEADRRLREEVAKANKTVVEHMQKHGYNWNQKKIDALTSFVYNLGPGALNQLTANGTRKDDEIAKKILEYNKIKQRGQFVQSPGLTARRQSELAMFTGGSESTAGSVLSASATPVKPTQTSGAIVSTASTIVADGQRTNLGQTGNVVVDNSQRTTVTSSQPLGKPASVYDRDIADALVTSAYA